MLKMQRARMLLRFLTTPDTNSHSIKQKPFKIMLSIIVAKKSYRNLNHWIIQKTYLGIYKMQPKTCPAHKVFILTDYFNHCTVKP
jgi:hypothetical protein